MNILNDKSDLSIVRQNEIEQVQQELQICNNCTACSIEIRKLFYLYKK